MFATLLQKCPLAYFVPLQALRLAVRLIVENGSKPMQASLEGAVKTRVEMVFNVQLHT
jgi:hypothetical protein